MMHSYRWALPMTVALCLLDPSGSAAQRHERTTVAIGSTAATQGGATAAAAFKDALATELSQLQGVGLAPAKRATFLVHGSVIRYERESDDRFRCEVSLLIADRRGGSVRMMLEGRAVAEGSKPVAQLRENALRHAVRGALRPLPQQLVAMR